MATKTIDNMDFYVAIAGYQLPSVPDQTFNSLRVSVGYSKGSGFYASFHPGWGDGSMWGCMFDFSKDPLLAGMTVDVVPAEKNNVKRIAEMTESLKMAKDIIAALFDDREWQKLKGVLQNVARFGYTDAFKEQAEKYLAERVSKRYEKAIKPTESDNDSSTNENSTTMAQNVKAADLIGKEIIMGTTGAKYVVKSVAEDKLICDFENPTQGMSSKNMPVPFANVQKFINDGKWTVADANEAATTDVTTEADVQEVQDIVPVVTPRKPAPKSEEPDPDAVGELVYEEPKAKVEPIKATVKPEPKPKAKTQPSAIKHQTSGKYVYATYQTSKGKTGAKITGVSETDAAYQQAAAIHASGSYERDKQGNKHYYLCFGPRYAEAAKKVCELLNAGKPIEDAIAVVNAATEERAVKKEEGRRKREEYRAQTSAISPQTSGEKSYTLDEVAAMLGKLLPNGAASTEDIKKLLKAA